MREFWSELWDDIRDILTPLSILIIVTIAVGIPFAICAWHISSTKAQLYNAKFGTSYTTAQFFWAGNAIQSFLNPGKQTTQNIKIEGAIPVIQKTGEN